MAVVILFYGLFEKLAIDDDPDTPNGVRDPHDIGDNYAAFQDVHVMVYIGFGFLYTFLRAHSWTSVALNWISGAWSMLCAMLWIGFWY